MILRLLSEFESLLVEGGEDLCRPSHQTNLVIVLNELSLLFWHFINATVDHLGSCEPSSSFTKNLHGMISEHLL